jgi:hypothetical protein
MVKKILCLTIFLSFIQTSVYAQDVVDEVDDIAEDQVEIDPWYGHYGIKLIGGYYNFNTVYENSQTKRDYSLPVGWLTVGGEISMRMGKDKSGLSKRNFHYYKSNDELFFDLEIGFRAFMLVDDSLPSSYSVQTTDKSTGAVTNETIELLGDSVVNSSACLVSGCSYPGTGNNADGITVADRVLYGGDAANVMLFYVNQYYAFTPLNWLVNIGNIFQWSDSSVGFSYRFALYDDYSDPYKAGHFSDDNIHGGIFIVVRQYIQLMNSWRLGGRYYFPIGHHAANLFYSESDTNFNEQIFEGWIEFNVFESLLLSAGYQYHTLNPNQLSPKSKNYSGQYISTRADSVMQSRTFGEVFLSVGFELPSHED